jgi:hypothetical protein
MKMRYITALIAAGGAAAMIAAAPVALADSGTCTPSARASQCGPAGPGLVDPAPVMQYVPNYLGWGG